MDHSSSDQTTEFDDADVMMLLASIRIVHHDGAIKMGQTQIDRNCNPDAVELAQTIIDAQPTDLKDMQDLLATL
ncbi:DUF305 domain-containing protein [Corynebacterium sp.]|uniref:DUF305 domain-containing protein n=1 Tax=Corynebacterium sp. TaxID=1720 RepID=UPI0028AE6510|nr:DUF305 domain-containing protein [Corynebacterium sp.]